MWRIPFSGVVPGLRESFCVRTERRFQKCRGRFDGQVGQVAARRCFKWSERNWVYLAAFTGGHASFASSFNTNFFLSSEEGAPLLCWQCMMCKDLYIYILKPSNFFLLLVETHSGVLTQPLPNWAPPVPG